MNSLDLTQLEKEVLMWLLAGDDPVIKALRRQLQEIRSIRRELTGVGIHLYFETSIDTQPLHKELDVKADFCFGDVEAETQSLKNGIGFLLWIRNGIITSLEGYTYDEI
mgnify:FL=1